MIVPAVTSVVPVKVFAPERVNDPAPTFRRVPDPLMIPANVLFALFNPTVKAAPEAGLVRAIVGFVPTALFKAAVENEPPLMTRELGVVQNVVVPPTVTDRAIGYGQRSRAALLGGRKTAETQGARQIPRGPGAGDSRGSYGAVYEPNHAKGRGDTAASLHGERIIAAEYVCPHEEGIACLKGALVLHDHAAVILSRGKSTADD
jgi:hypothetical protein